MTATRQGRLKKAAALVPLALLSAAWTVSISTTGASQATADDGGSGLPDGTALPGEALQVPASVSAPDASALGVTGESSTQIVSTATAYSIPSTALAAYQRAETVINRADTTCHLPWQLLAAIGRVESDHGRANGNQLSAEGTAEPGIFGKALDGTGDTSRIADTDGGRYDGDTGYDRAVGPMQFIPSTWSTVGVDADGDGQRNPQDIDDAALAAAVYLCSGTDDLSSAAGQSAAVYRYNHSTSYVTTVLAVMRSYLAGDFTAAPNYTIPATYFVPDHAPARPKHKDKAAKHPAPTPSGPVAPASSAPATPTAPTVPKPPTTTKPSASASPRPTTPSVPIEEPVKQLAASVQELRDICTGALTANYGDLSGDNLRQAVTKCVNQLEGKTLPQAQAAVGGVVSGLADFVRGLLGGLIGGLLGH